MRLVAGLGNPGSDYDGTRHNVGFEVVDILAGRHGVALRTRECQALVGRGRVAEEAVLLAKPQTFMNHSGEAVSGLLTKHGLDLLELLVVSDDIDLSLGVLRLRASGSSGGQKGLRSVEQCLGSREYARLRIGIRGVHYEGGRDLSDYVLERFEKSERSLIREAVLRAADAVETWAGFGIREAMNRFNATPE